jgi:hypothetical protein
MVLPSYDFSAPRKFAGADEGADEPQRASLDRWNRPGGDMCRDLGAAGDEAATEAERRRVLNAGQTEPHSEVQ